MPNTVLSIEVYPEIVEVWWFACMKNTSVSRKNKLAGELRVWVYCWQLMGLHRIAGSSEFGLMQSVSAWRTSGSFKWRNNSFSIKYLQYNLKLSGFYPWPCLSLAEINIFLSNVTPGFTHLSQKSTCVPFPKWFWTWQTWVYLCFFQLWIYLKLKCKAKFRG